MDVRLAETLGRLAQEIGAEMRDLLAAFPQGRHENPNHAQAVVQVLAKLAFRHALFEVRVGGRQHPHVDFLRFRLSDRHDLLLLQEPEQLGLDVEREIADFVQEQCAARRRPHQPGLIRHRPGEAAALVTKQLAVGQVAAGGGAVVRQKGRGASMRPHVNGAGDELLTGAALARDQHVEIVALHPLNLFHDAVHGRAGAEEAGQQRLERSINREVGDRGGAIARRA